MTIPMTRFTDHLIDTDREKTTGGRAVNDEVLKIDLGRQALRRATRSCATSRCTLHRHEVVCLIGASGSGKSTLLRCANLLETIDGGDIELFGQSLLDPRIDPDLVRRHIGMVFQSFNLFPHLSVLENIALGPVRALKRPTSEVRDEAMDLLARIGLRDRADDFPDRLSGGQQQRVAIVRSLAMRPSLLLLDEVTSALDPTLVGEVLDLLTRPRPSGTTMLIATHEMNFARDVAHQVAFLDNGVLVEQGTPEQIFDHPSTRPRGSSSNAFARTPARAVRASWPPGRRVPGRGPRSGARARAPAAARPVRRPRRSGRTRRR